MPIARTTISIERTTLERFFRAYPPGKRNVVIQGLIERDLAVLPGNLLCPLLD